MILKVSIGSVEVLYDDDIDEIPAPAYRDDTLNALRLNAINAWMALPTILDTDLELDNAAHEPATEGDA